MSVRAARSVDAIGQEVRVQGWIRTRRDSKAGFSFLEVNDGSSFANIQVIADAELANYESDIRRLSTGCSVSITSAYQYVWCGRSCAKRDSSCHSSVLSR